MRQFRCLCAVLATEENGKIIVDVVALCPKHELKDFIQSNKSAFGSREESV